MSQRKRNLTSILHTIYLGCMIVTCLFGLFGLPVILILRILAEGWTIIMLTCFSLWVLLVALTVSMIALWIRNTVRELASLATLVFTH